MGARTAKRLAAPAAFLLAATVAILLVRSALHQGTGTTGGTTVLAPVTTRKVVVTQTRPRTTTKRQPAQARFYTVAAGDTFEVIASKTGLSVVRIQALNPKVQSTALFVGQKLRIR